MTERAVSGTREGRNDRGLDPPAPAAENQRSPQGPMNFFAQPPLGADGEAIADDEHPDHQLQIREIEGRPIVQ